MFAYANECGKNPWKLFIQPKIYNIFKTCYVYTISPRLQCIWGKMLTGPKEEEDMLHNIRFIFHQILLIS
jgi:hypothetical protein